MYAYPFSLAFNCFVVCITILYYLFLYGHHLFTGVLRHHVEDNNLKLIDLVFVSTVFVVNQLKTWDGFTLPKDATQLDSFCFLLWS